MEFEPGNEFEQELRQALERRPAPPGLKRRLMEKRSRRHTERLHTYTMIWERLEERARGEAARQQVLTALRITSHALNQMNMQLAAHRRDGQDQ